MKINIYQIDMDRDTNEVAFSYYDSLNKWQGTHDIDSSIYNLVFSGDVNTTDLEQVYLLFNRKLPRCYTGRSLSVSDVIEIIDEPSKYYYVDDVGMKSVSFDKTLCKTDKGVLRLNAQENKKKYPIGTHIELENMEGELNMQPGLKGTVTDVDDIGQVHIAWENGSSLALNTDVDNFKVIDEGKKISVVYCEAGKIAERKEIFADLEAMQKAVGGYIEEYQLPNDDNVSIICNEEGKILGLPLNRGVYTDTEIKEMTYWELKDTLTRSQCVLNKEMKGYIVFSQDSFTQPYTETQRTYEISSDNKAFCSNCVGTSIFGSCVDGSDDNVRLDLYIDNANWKIEKCYTKLESRERELVDIIAGNFFLAYSPVDAEEFQSLPKDLEDKYLNIYKYPERFYKTIDGQLKSEPYKPQIKDYTKE